MPVKGLPATFRCGRTYVLQHPGPIHTQTTYVLQRPGWVTRFDKTMHSGVVEVGDGLCLTLLLLPVTIPPQEHIAGALHRWRDEVLASVATVAVLLDDRVAQERVLEDVIVLDASGNQPVASLDISTRVRHFPPAKAVTQTQLSGLQILTEHDSEAQTPEHVAARWYLRAAQAGPTPDAIVHLWIALEALVPARGAGRSSDVAGVEDALREAGSDPADWQPSVGRCAGLRAEIVHHGKEQPDLLSEGYYSLETMVRLLLGHRLGIGEHAWPAVVSETNLRWPFRRVSERLAQELRTTLRRVQDETRQPEL